FGGGIAGAEGAGYGGRRGLPALSAADRPADETREALGKLVQEVNSELQQQQRLSAANQPAAPKPQAQPPPPEKRGTLNLNRTPPRSPLEQLFQGPGLQYAVDATVPNPPVTLNFRDLPATTALRALVRLASAQVPGLTFNEDNGIFIVKIRSAVAA